MTLWLIFGGLTLGSLTLLLTPLLRRAPQAASRLDYDLHVYREQLAELERDRERGVLAEDLADSARTEIHRRMLAADQPEIAPGGRRRTHIMLAAVLLVVMPIATLSLYVHLGSPKLPDQPFAARQSDPAFHVAAIAEELATRLATAPEGEGFRHLGDAYMMLQRFDDAAKAYDKAQNMGFTDAAMESAYGEALTMISDGMVVPDARRQFQQSLSLDPENPQSRFYMGLAEAQIGNYQKAVAIWRDLEAGSAEDAPWMDTLRTHIAAAAKEGAFDPQSVAPIPAASVAGPPGTQDQAAAAIRAQAPDDQAKIIRGMVDGLAARLRQQPDDYDGWMRLARSYKVLGESVKSADAARHAITLRPKDVEPRLALAQMQLGTADESALPADFLATLRDVLAIDAKNPTALYFLGASEAAAGHAAEARRLWGALLEVLPADRPERAEIAKRRDALPKTE